MGLRTVLLLLFVAACGHDEPFGVTYHRDVRPIIERRCGECHEIGGVGGIVFDERSVPSLIDVMLTKILDGDMPPYPPSPESLPLRDSRRMQPTEIATLQAWRAIGRSMGDPTSYLAPFASGFDEPDLALRMPVPFLASAKVSDSFRCFYLDAPPLWVRGYRWSVKDSTRRASHHVRAAVLTETGRDRAKSLDGADGLPGWDCPMDYGLRAGDVATSLGSSGVGKTSPVLFAAGLGIEAPAGFVLEMHYLPERLREPDQSGVDLWTTDPVTPVREWLVATPVELPCPTGVSLDPAHPCSRERALADSSPMRPLDELRRSDDDGLALCGQTYDGFMGAIDWRQGPERFLVSTSCERSSPFSGRLLSVHVHAHTRAVSARAELQLPDGAWLTLLDIPRWRWVWEEAYSLVAPVPIGLGQRVRVSCTLDNGSANQWSVFDGPGHDGPATPPLEPPAFRVSGPRRTDEMCGVTFQWYNP